MKDSSNFTDSTGEVDTALMGYLEKWFNELTGVIVATETDPNRIRYLRLAACIAIDIKSGNFTAKDYLKLFQNFSDSPTVSIFQSFDDAITEAFPLPIANYSTRDKVQYARVMTFKQYDERYLKSTTRAALSTPRKKSPLAKNAHKHRNLDFDDTTTWADYYLNDDKQIPFKKIKPTLTMRAGNDWAWITPKDELEDTINDLKAAGKLNIGQIIALRLGLILEDLAFSTDNGYIYFVYPPNFNEPVYQPTAILAKGWKWQHGFISYKKQDSYGRTFDFSGLKPNFKERIHHGFPAANYHFKAFVVGSRTKKVDEVNDMMSKESQKRIYEEAVARFKKIKLV